MRSGSVVGRLLTVASLTMVSLSAQWSKDPFTNYVMNQSTGLQTIGDQVAKLAGSVAEFGVIKRRLETKIIPSRKEFWRRYQSRPMWPSQDPEFGYWLQQKDYLYLMPGTDLLDHPVAQTLSGAPADGGIPLRAKDSFDLWSNEVFKAFGKDVKTAFESLVTAAMPRILAEKRPLYREYVVLRDLEEFTKAGVNPPGIPRELWSLIGAAIRKSEHDGDSPLADSGSPYGWAFSAWRKGSSFAASCPGVLRALGSGASKNCLCVENTFRSKLDPSEFFDISSNFTEERFLLSSVSRVGLSGAIAACLRPAGP